MSEDQNPEGVNQETEDRIQNNMRRLYRRQSNKTGFLNSEFWILTSDFCLLTSAVILLTLGPGAMAAADDEQPQPASPASVLAQRVAGFDAARAHDAALSAMLASADPGARWLSEAEAQAWRKQTSTGMQADVAVKVQDWPEGLRYIRTAQLSGAARPALAEALAKSGASSGLILDLRGAGGTDLTAVVEASGVCVTGGAALFSVVESGDVQRLVTASANASALTRPLAVLVDERSSGGADLLAGVLRGRPGVMLIGRPTAGEMCRRELVDMGNGRWALAAVTRWVPAGPGHTLAGGVTPDIVLEERTSSAAPGTSLSPSPGDKRWSNRTASEHELIKLVGRDGALQRAVDLLLAARAVGAYANR